MIQLLYSIPLMVCAMKSVQAAEVCSQHNGSYVCGQGEIDTCQGTGLITIDGTKVLSTCSLNGSIKIVNAGIHSLHSAGDMVMNNSVVDYVQHRGSLKADHSKINEAQCHLDHAVINGGHIQNMVVHAKHTAHVYLTQGATIRDIRFLGAKGVVHASHDALVSHIEGGEIIQK